MKKLILLALLSFPSLAIYLNKPMSKFVRYFTAILFSIPLISLSSPANASLTCADLNGAYLYSQEFTPKYLGFFGNSSSRESINNPVGTYGASYLINSVRSTFGAYGPAGLNYSAQNANAFSPPKILKNGVHIGYLTSNTNISDGYSLSLIDNNCSFSASLPSLNPASLSNLVSVSGSIGAVLSWSSAPLATAYNIYQCTDSFCVSDILLGEVATTSTTIN